MIKPAAGPGASPKMDATRFAFGENWRSFAANVSEAQIAEAARGLERLFPEGGVEGRRVLDIGCGSGLSMLALARLDAGSLTGIDLDPDSVAAAHALLTRHPPAVPWSVRQADVFELSPAADGVFDIVYSWGVLHHTGDLWAALARAAALLAPGGQLAVAIYRRTPLCRLWRWEKRNYSRAGPTCQSLMRAVYKSLFTLGLIATGRSPRRYRQDYVSARGMNWAHDVHDWLGGYPYQSASPTEMRTALARLGFDLVRSFEKKPALAGLFGSHCDEYVARRRRSDIGCTAPAASL